MTAGKSKCKILKEIRQKIADENDIPLVTRECTYQGECRGTCPRCEEELQYLERQLAKRRRLGMTVAVAAVCAGVAVTAKGCSQLKDLVEPVSTTGAVVAVDEDASADAPGEGWDLGSGQEAVG